MAYFDCKQGPRFRGKFFEKEAFADITAGNHFWVDVD